ncbi:hypothetical protein [Nostoc sp.]|uniref:hypothetical protein n=1 Tax=Nostoc sp. TaxID=1180 RepID=UPI002FF6F570
MTKRLINIGSLILRDERELTSESQTARTYQELNQAITQALETITKKDIIGWFTLLARL